MLLSIGIDTLPWILFDVDFDFEDVAVGGDEMAAEEDGELFRAAHAVLLRQQVHRVLLRVGGDDVTVVAILVILQQIEKNYKNWKNGKNLKKWQKLQKKIAKITPNYKNWKNQKKIEKVEKNCQN